MSFRAIGPGQIYLKNQVWFAFGNVKSNGDKIKIYYGIGDLVKSTPYSESPGFRIYRLKSVGNEYVYSNEDYVDVAYGELHQFLKDSKYLKTTNAPKNYEDFVNMVIDGNSRIMLILSCTYIILSLLLLTSKLLGF